MRATVICNTPCRERTTQETQAKVSGAKAMRHVMDKDDACCNPP
jgi:hypothetical protein